MSFDLSNYEPVQSRIAKFWADHPDGRISTSICDAPEGSWVVKAEVWKQRPWDGAILSVPRGLSQEEAEAVKEAWRAKQGDHHVTLISGMEVTPAPPDATGLAQEVIGQGNVNRTSALENCETSAIGRALANLGYAPSSERPPREEMEHAQAATPHAEPVASPAMRDALKDRIGALESNGVPAKELWKAHPFPALSKLPASRVNEAQEFLTVLEQEEPF